MREGLDECRPLIKRLLEVGVSIAGAEAKSAPVAQVPQEVKAMAVGIAGKKFVFTGTRECTKEVEAAGGIVQDGIRKDTEFLVQKDPSKISNKTKKAEEQGTKVISLDYLKEVLAGTASL